MTRTTDAESWKRWPWTNRVVDRAPIAALSLLLGLTCACGSPQPTGPSGPSLPTPTGPSGPTPSTTGALGFALDTAFQRLAGVRVEVLDGPAAGVSATSGGDGRFWLAVPVGSDFMVRATKADYVTVLESHRAYASSSGTYFSPALFLTPTDNVVFEPGAYSVTLDFPCGGVPEDLRTQTFPAAVTLLPRTPPGPGFWVTIDHRFSARSSNGFRFGVAGRSVGVPFEALYWEVPSFRYFEAGFGQDEQVRAVPADASTFSIPAGVDYCELNSPMGDRSDCSTSPASEVITRVFCPNGRLTLAPR